MDIRRGKDTSEDQVAEKTGSRLPKRVRVGFFIVIAVFCIAGYVSMWRYIHRAPVQGGDFGNYYIAAFAAEELPGENIYEVQGAHTAAAALYEKAVASKQELLAKTAGIWIGGLEQTPTTFHFNTSPFLYTVLSVFRFENYLLSLWTYRLFSLICYVLAIWWLCCRIGYSVFFTGIILLILTSWFGPFRYSMLLLNVDSLQLAALMLFLYLLSRDSSRAMTFASGVLLGLTFAFKPNIVFVVLMLGVSWISNRRFKTLVFTGLGIAGGVAFAALVSIAFFGSVGVWLEWPGRLKMFVNDAFGFADNYAIAKIIRDRYGVMISPYLAVFLLCAASGVVWVCRRPAHPSSQGRERARNANAFFHEDLLMISIGLLVYLLSGPVVWEHYFIYTIAVMLITFRSFWGPEALSGYELAVRQILVVLSFLGISIRSIVTVPENIAALSISGGALILFALALWELWRFRGKWAVRDTPALYSPDNDFRTGGNNTAADWGGVFCTATNICHFQYRSMLP